MTLQCQIPVEKFIVAAGQKNFNLSFQFIDPADITLHIMPASSTACCDIVQLVNSVDYTVCGGAPDNVKGYPDTGVIKFDQGYCPDEGDTLCVYIELCPDQPNLLNVKGDKTKALIKMFNKVSLELQVAYEQICRAVKWPVCSDKPTLNICTPAQNAIAGQMLQVKECDGELGFELVQPNPITTNQSGQFIPEAFASDECYFLTPMVNPSTNEVEFFWQPITIDKVVGLQDALDALNNATNDITTNSGPFDGDMKMSRQEVDHGYWVRLDGRVISSIGLSANRLAAANALFSSGVLEDWRGRFGIGGGAQGGVGTNYNLGDTGGAETHTLTEPETPQTTDGELYLNNYVGNDDAAMPSGVANLQVLAAYRDFRTSNANGGLGALVEGSNVVTNPNSAGAPHNNMPPYVVGNWFIFIKG